MHRGKQNVMNIHFFTQNLNPRLYTRILREYIYDMYDEADFDYIAFMNRWIWEFHPSTDAPNDPHFDGQDGVGAVTGMGLTKFYLEDKKTNLIHDIFQRVLRQNVIVMTHDGGHAILIHEGMNRKVKLRHDDFSGHKAGTELNFSTAEIHDRHTEGRFKRKRVWFWDWKTFKAYRVNVSYVDIDDLV